MSVVEDFGRWLAAAKALEQVRREDRPPAQIADVMRLHTEALEALLRSIVTTVRRNELNIQRLADTNWQMIAAEVEPLRERQTELAALLHQVREELAAEDANFDAPGD